MICNGAVVPEELGKQPGPIRGEASGNAAADVEPQSKRQKSDKQTPDSGREKGEPSCNSCITCQGVGGLHWLASFVSPGLM